MLDRPKGKQITALPGETIGSLYSVVCRTKRGFVLIYQSFEVAHVLRSQLKGGMISLRVLFRSEKKYYTSSDARNGNGAIKQSEKSIVENTVGKPDLSLTTTTLVQGATGKDIQSLQVSFLYQISRAVAAAIACLIMGLAKIHSALKETKHVKTSS